MSIEFHTQGDFKKTRLLLWRFLEQDPMQILTRYGELGVEALKKATPKDTGATSESWTYEIKRVANGYELHFNNPRQVAGESLVLMLQYGHGTGRGRWVPGRDFINPALKPIFRKLSKELRKGERRG